MNWCKRTHINIKFIFKSVIVILLLVGCDTPQIKQPEEKILVRIGDKATISLNEFLRRAEYTIRPPYCKHNTYIHKKIILNSLIAEKLLALEAGDDNPLLQSEAFQRFIKGRKEQAMRQWMHYQQATQHVKLDTSEIKKFFRLAGREYEIEYFFVDDTSIARKISKKQVIDNHEFEQVYRQINGDTTLPKRKVSWGKQEHDKILQALFSQPLTKGQVLEPIKINDSYLLIKIAGWTDTKVITERQIQERWNKVTEELTRIKASVIWSKIVGDIMRGKTIEFVDDTFWKLSRLFFKIYFKTDEQKKDALQQQIWDIEKSEQQALNELISENISQQPFFTVDGKTWTVEDFRKELMSHPLVFRERKMPSNEFPQQFRLAVVDLIRDHYITREAYKKGYDRVNIVQRNANMWRDTFLAIYQKSEYLRTIGDQRNFGRDYMRIIGDHLNAYVDSLQAKYHKKVELDFDEFENIALTSIDLFVKQADQPYPYVVPLFPVITTDHSIEYITKMKR